MQNGLQVRRDAHWEMGYLKIINTAFWKNKNKMNKYE